MRLKKKNLIEDEKVIVSLNPKSLISHFYNKVNLSTAAIVIFVSIFLETLILLLLKTPTVLSFFTIRILTSFILSWIVLGTLLYLILYFVKGRDNLSGGEFKKILSGLASFRIVSILSILVVLVIILIFMPKVIPFASLVIQNPTTFQDTGMLPSIGAGTIVGIFLLFIFSIVLVIYYLCLLYHFVKLMYDYKIGGTLLMTLIILVGLYFFSLLI